MIRSQSKNRRRNYFIKKKFQASFILKFCLLVVLTALISAVVIYRFSSQSVTTVFENSRLIIKPGTEFILPGLILSTLMSVIFVGIATIIIVLFMSHRIAGPLYKLEDSLERMANGDMSFDIYFRKGDEAKKLAEIFNMTSQRLNNLVSDVKQEVARLDPAINEIKALAEKSPAERKALKEAIEKLEIINSRLNKGLIRFRLR